MTMYGNIEAGRGINVAPVSGGVRVAADVAGLTGGSGITVADTGNGTYSITATVASISAVVATPLAAAASAGALGTAADAGHEHPRLILGTAAGTIGMNRHSTSNTAGNALTVTGGGATLGATNKAGGNLVLAGGLGTGTGASGSVLVQAHAAGGSGTTDGTLATVATFDSTGLSVVGNVTATGVAARTVGMARNGTADTAGQGLTVDAGGATSGSTNKAGGDLTLQSGTSTGTQASSIVFNVPTAGGSGTTDRTPATVLTLAAATATFVNSIVTRAATTAAGTAPIKVTAGALMTAPEAGAIELDSNHWYLTDGGGNRRCPIQAAVGASVDVAGAPNTNTGKFPIIYNGTTINVMVCA